MSIDLIGMWLALITVLVITVCLVLGGGLAYFVAVGVRAIYRETARTSRESGHTALSASVRATLRMTVWAAFFALLYALLYFVGRRIGWWTIIPGAAAGVIAVAALLQADRLLTMPRREVKGHVAIAASILTAMVLLSAITWYAARA